MEYKTLVQECMEAYGVDSPNKLAKIIGIPYTTLNPWNSEKGPSQMGEVLLKTLIENALLKKHAAALVNAEDKKQHALQHLKVILGQNIH
jgi:hypothetical protein